jgi:hypothetical protein
VKDREEQFRQLEIRRRNEEYYKKMELERKLQREKIEREMGQRKKAESSAGSKKSRKKAEEEMKKRYYYGWKPSVRPKEAPKEDWKAVEGKPRRKMQLVPQQRKAPGWEAAQAMHTESDEEIAAKLDEKHEVVILSLEAEKGLPVSLSCGQKGIRTLFIARNSTAKKATVELAVSLLDAKKGLLGAKAEPANCTIDANGEAHFAVEFDLKETVATGLLTLNAVLKENAIYVDRDPAKSNAVQLISKVKTAMDLEYKKGTAAFAEEKGGAVLLCAEFYNRGESGGTLNLKSSVGYGTDGKMLRASLVQKVKIKGMQKKVELKFSPAKRVPVEAMIFELLGMDSNGKQYKARKIVKEKIE